MKKNMAENELKRKQKLQEKIYTSNVKKLKTPVFHVEIG